MPAIFPRFRGPGQTILHASIKASDNREQDETDKTPTDPTAGARAVTGSSAFPALSLAADAVCFHIGKPLLQTTPVGLSRKAKSSKRPFKYGHRAPSRSKHELVRNRCVRRRRATLQAHPDIILDTQYHRLANKKY